MATPPKMKAGSSASPPPISPNSRKALLQAMQKNIESLPYSEDDLKQALQSLLQGSTDPASDARHLYGHDRRNNGQIQDHHVLSMLQIITAARILDYQLDCDLSSSNKDKEKIDYTNQPRLNLQSVIQNQAPRMALAAEFKRASPSKGAIANDMKLKAGDQAQIYYKAGADIISVLTESRWFQGSLHDLTEVRMQTSKVALDLGRQRPAVLRKDFVVSQQMIQEAAAAGADSVLLIVAVLPLHLLRNLINFSRSLDMEPLVEVHADSELTVALQAGAAVIGVNNRNLHTFQMDLSTSNRIAERLGYQGLEFNHNSCSSNNNNSNNNKNNMPQYTLCALSGMSTAYNVDRYRQVGVGMCLIGESLMRSTDPAAAIRALCLHPDDFSKFLSSSSTSSSSATSTTTIAVVGGAYTGGTQLVKVCGITNASDALVACRSGANLIGVIFAEKSKRRVTVRQAKEVVQAVLTFGERSNSRTDWKVRQDIVNALPHLAASSAVLAETATPRRPAVVGVFQNQNADFINQMVKECGLDLVQLHGTEGMAAANAKICGVPAIRVVDIHVDGDNPGKASETAVETILQSVTNDPIAILLDTSIKGQTDGGGGGGTGVSFDWKIAQRIQEAGLPVIVAGGLTPDSVLECVGTIRPFGVDVSSGVEVAPGRKDPDKVRAFVQGARQAAEEANKGF